MLLPVRRNLLLTISLAWAVGAVARLGLWLSIVPGPVAANWLAAGLSLAALMVFGRRAVAGLAIGLLVANWLQGVGSFVTFDAAAARVAILITLGELAQALLAAWALTSMPRELPRNPVRQTLRYALTVAPCGLVAATVGTLAWLSLPVAPHGAPLFGWVAGWLGDVTGMLVVTPVLLLLFHPRLRTDRLTVQPFPLICLGLGLTAFCTFAVGLGVRDTQTERFKADAGRLAMTLQTHVELTARDLETLQHYFYKIDVDPNEFRSVTTPLLARSPWQSTFAWLPRVTIALREAFESSPSGLDGTSIREVDAYDSVVKAGLRDEYFPVAWTDPAAGREALIGLDDSHDAQRGSALARAIAAHAMSSTPPLSTVVNSPEGKLVQTLYAPVDNEAVSKLWPSDPGHVRGMVAATLDLAALLEASVAQMGTRDETLLLFDPDAPRSAALLWSAGQPLRIVEPARRDDLIDRIDGGVSMRHEIRVADRRWTMLARPAWADAMPRPGWLQASVLASGLAFTALLTALLAARRRRDELLQDAREQLEVQVEARTRDLGETNTRLRDEIEGHRRTEALLQDARQSAEAASRAKSQFLANMSHEIRTPLNGVLGMAQVMAMNPLSEAQKDRLDVVQKSGATLLSVLNDLLDLSRIEAGQLELEQAPFDIKDVASGAYSTFTSIANANGVSFSLVITPEAEGRWRGDSVRVRQVLYNLISNALKFTSEGQVQVHIGAAVSSGGKALSISIADTGIGISPDVLPHLFEKFVQADNTMTRRFGGAGLGLAICRRIVELMGGAITVQSAVGEGTTFQVNLPLEWLGPVIAHASPPTMGDTGAAPVCGFEGLRILAAEDNATNQLVLKTVLYSLGLEPMIVDDGRRAVEAWSRDRFDLVLMDIQMPEMDGVAATREIRRREAETGARRTPIVALSANAMKHQVAEYLAAGMDAHLCKPIEIDRLYATLLAVGAGEPLSEDETIAA